MKKELKKKLKRYKITSGIILLMSLVLFLVGLDKVLPTANPFTKENAYWERVQTENGYRYYVRHLNPNKPKLFIQCAKGEYVNLTNTSTIVSMYFEGRVIPVNEITMNGVSWKVPGIDDKNLLMRDKNIIDFTRALTRANVISVNKKNIVYSWNIGNTTKFSRCDTF